MEFPAAHGQPAHFAINVDNMNRAQQFYEAVFGWKFHAYGPPGFFMVETVAPGAKALPTLVSIQGRRELVPGVRMTGFECTMAVSDIDTAIVAIEANGGTIVMARCTLPSIGHLVFFQDPEGNLAGAMQYDANAE